MELWYTEDQLPGLRLSFRVKKTLSTLRTDYQDLAIIDTEAMGPMLVLDGLVMSSAADEFVYHEMLSHPALFTHPMPSKVAIIGGGDGGALREALKHPQVKTAFLAEIDEQVIAQSQRFLPGIAGVFADPRAKVVIGDGLAFLQERPGQFDVVLVDSTEPKGASAILFSEDFYGAAFRALKTDGLLAAQTESPFYNQDILLGATLKMKTVFSQVHTYLASIPTYPSGLWSFTVASNRYHPLHNQRLPGADFTAKYYTPELHRSCFTLPRFVQELLERP